MRNLKSAFRFWLLGKKMTNILKYVYAIFHEMHAHLNIYTFCMCSVDLGETITAEPTRL